MAQKDMYKREDKPTPPLWLALIPIVITGAGLGFSVFLFDAEPHFSLLLGAGAAGICAYGWGYTWTSIKDGFKRSISRTVPSLIILLILGMLIAVWIASGIVPALMYLGLNFFVAQWFLPLILLFCCVMALITGSSWSTIGTMGVAAIGISEGLGIPLHITAGAVVSGSFFGDKLSPMSDTTNITPSVLGVNLYDHIRHMLYTTVPALLVTAITFTVIGFMLEGDGGNGGDISLYLDGILDNFTLSPWLIIPPLLVIALIVSKIPAIPSLLTGVLLGGATYLFVQGGTISELLAAIQSGYALDSPNEEINELFSRGGMESMYDVVTLAMFALVFGGIMNRTGMLHRIVLSITSLITSVGNLTLVVLSTSLFINIFGANQYLAVILPGQMFEECYRDKKLKLKNLTRTLEAGGTLTSPLIPWNSSAVFVNTALGIPVIAYAPYAVLCWITFIIVAIWGYTGISMQKHDEAEEEEECNQ